MKSVQGDASGHEQLSASSHGDDEIMIFLAITVLAWTILSIGMVGVEWGYGAWAQARLYTTAQFLVLDSFSRTQNQMKKEAIVRMIMGNNSTTKVEEIFSSPGVTQIRLAKDIGWPLPSLLRGNTVHQPSTVLGVVSSATAQLLPARQVGLPQSGHNRLLGALPCTLGKAAWESMPDQTPVAVLVNSLGEIYFQGKNIGQFGQLLTHIGQAVSDPQALQPLQVRLEGYVPIFTKIGKINRVVGFGRVQMYGTYPHVWLRKQVSTTRSHNASTQLTGERPRLRQQDLAQVFSINRKLQGAVLAPTLI
ncbi:MAG: hypothetical protein NPIRA04_12530 [Nitrospirales bacterium]|nr:MAG: hypothetical protein NPIRA04_12530 [Nitrospirales bacterium]